MIPLISANRLKLDFYFTETVVRAGLMVLCLGISACGSSYPADSQVASVPHRLHWEIRAPKNVINPTPIPANTLSTKVQFEAGLPHNGNEDLPDLPEIGTGAATLSWMPPSATLDGSPFRGVDAYRIDYGRDPAVLERTIMIDNPGITRYVVENLPPGKWYFRVTAFDADGNQSLSTHVGAKIVG